MPQSPSAVGTLLTLSDDVLSDILLKAARAELQRYLCGVFPLICKRFKKLCSGSCSSLTPRIHRSDQEYRFACWLSKHGQAVEELQVPSLETLLQLPGVLPYLKQLRSLDVDASPFPAPSTYSSFSSLTSLTKLVLQGFMPSNPTSDLLGLLQGLPALRDLQLPYMGDDRVFSGEELHHLASSLPGLTRISFTERTMADSALAAFSEFGSLQQIDSEDLVDAHMLQSFQPTLPLSLLTISLDPYAVDSEEAAGYVSSWLEKGGGQHLRDLSFFLVEENPRVFFAQEVISRLASLPRLQRLKIEAEGDDMSLPLNDQQLRQLTNLTGFWVDRMKDFTPSQLPPNLLGLSLYGDPSVLWTDEEDVRTNLSQLTSLELRRISRKQLQHLKVLTNLRTLELESPHAHLRHLEQPLKSLTLLSRLAIRFRWREEEVPSIVELLSGLPELRSFWLRSSQEPSSDVGVAAVVELVTRLPQLERLTGSFDRHGGSVREVNEGERGNGGEGTSFVLGLALDYSALVL